MADEGTKSETALSLLGPEMVLVHNCEADDDIDGYWLGKDRMENAWILVDIGCERFVEKVLLKNSKNRVRTFER